jgi:hypothetical protein
MWPYQKAHQYHIVFVFQCYTFYGYTFTRNLGKKTDSPFWVICGSYKCMTYVAGNQQNPVTMIKLHTIVRTIHAISSINPSV